MRTAWLGLGANLGDPAKGIERALRWLDGAPGVHVEARSQLRWTEPVGPPQPRFLNGVVRLRTSRVPGELLRLTQALERAAGRRTGPRWGPRPLDLDILMIDDLVVETHALVLPHPRLHLRTFVLEPMCDLDPGLEHPGLGVSMDTLLKSL
ncbi:MAG: 2-amino-4-hydroxy-6-hydroxymethyldihydropteridine diphosphokinase [Myxococcota bacterium]|nr:2-amino-4-hydroxy-6-hydroxymethyldihydropteridine diphosphokinase [Myxococcota bacterium]MEE2779480.1 2-amino-4-hydroxy-6-hydroxymethyldihydropteridine diphosphokinase [Myxococcota bacterium]